MEKEFHIPSNIPVIEKGSDYPQVATVEKPVNSGQRPSSLPGIETKEQEKSAVVKTSVPRPGISISERTVEGYVIPDNISVIDNYIKENMGDLETPPTDLNKPVQDEVPFDIWKQIEEEFDSTEYLTEDSAGNVMINEEKLFTWLKQKLGSVSFCETYLTDKLDGSNGVVQENATLILQSDKGSRFFLNKAGQYHRLDGPAIEWCYGGKEFFKNGIRHRIGGPAYEYKEEIQFWFDGKQYNENEYWEVAKEITSLK